MKFLRLILPNFKRHKTRTVLTVLSIIVAFTLFGYLAAIRKAFEMGVSVAGADRLGDLCRPSLRRGAGCARYWRCGAVPARTGPAPQ